MRVLQVNNVDLPGKRFNGFDLIEPLGSLGIDSDMAVLQKTSDESAVVALHKGEADAPLSKAVRELELQYGMNGILYPWGVALSRTEAFRSADVVHYHLIHNGLISLLDLPRLFSEKPSVWTFHDSWPLTAHCVQPCGCQGWLSGCCDCGRPELPFPLQSEHSEKMWRVKDDVYARLDVDIVVATSHMRERVERSPLGEHFDHVHTIPFGAGGLQVPERVLCRAALGIDADAFVVLFRAAEAEVKGLKYLVEALNIAPPMRPTSLLAVDHVGLLSDLAKHYDIHEFGWADDALYSQLLGACDVVVTPYAWAVGFGLMAAEAMAAARAVVCFEGTSIAAVTRAPECGVAVRNGDAESLRHALDGLMERPEECVARGKAGQEIARREYGQDAYARRMAGLYRSVAARHASTT